MRVRPQGGDSPTSECPYPFMSSFPGDVMQCLDQGQQSPNIPPTTPQLGLFHEPRFFSGISNQSVQFSRSQLWQPADQNHQIMQNLALSGSGFAAPVHYDSHQNSLPKFAWTTQAPNIFEMNVRSPPPAAISRMTEVQPRFQHMTEVGQPLEPPSCHNRVGHDRSVELADTQCATQEPSTVEHPTPTPTPKSVVPEVTMEELAELPDEEYRARRFLLPGGNLPLPKPPPCGCPAGARECGPFYSHLGHGMSVMEIRRGLEENTPWSGQGIRFEKILLKSKEGKNELGCPIAKSVIRRSGPEEKLLVIVKHRPDHVCKFAWIVVAFAVWEGIPRNEADYLYSLFSKKLPDDAREFKRKCGANKEKTCACQGTELGSMGFSASFGCSFSMWTGSCKYARSDHEDVMKFRMKKRTEDDEVKEALFKLSNRISGSFGSFIPSAFRNLTTFSDCGRACRIGDPTLGPLPFSGVTACVDFCAHSHKDSVNMNGGLTLVVTLSKNRDLPCGKKPPDEQLHTLPFYVLDDWDENGDMGRVEYKRKIGALETLTQFFTRSRVRKVPLKSCKEQAQLQQRLEVKRKRETSSGESPKSTAKRRIVKGGPSSQPMLSTQISAFASPMPSGIPQVAHSSAPPSLSHRSAVSEFHGRWLDFADPNMGAVATPNQMSCSPTSAAPYHVYLTPTTPKLQQAGNDSYAQGLPTQPFPPFESQPPQLPTPPVSFGSYVSPAGATLMNGEGVLSPVSETERHFPPNNGFSRLTSNLSHYMPYAGSNIKVSEPVPNEIKQNFSNVVLSPKSANNDEDDDEDEDNGPPGLWNVWQDPQAGSRCVSGQFVVSYVPQQPLPSCPYLPLENVVHAPQSFEQIQANAPSVTPVPIQSYYAEPACPWSPPQPSASAQQQWIELGFRTSELNRPYLQPLHPSSEAPLHLQSTVSASANSWPSLSRQPPRPASAPPAEGFEFEVKDSWNVQILNDPDVGGVAIALEHGSVYFEPAKYEVHATTALQVPNPRSPTRISLVFYQHKTLNYPCHGHEVMLRHLEAKQVAKEADLKAPKIVEPALNAAPGIANCGVGCVPPARSATSSASGVNV